MILKNGKIFGEDRVFHCGNITVLNEKIVQIEYFDDKIKEKKVTVEESVLNTEEVLDCTDMYVVPGFVDIHFHGCIGYDFSDASFLAIHKIYEYQLQNGITSIVPATMTLSKEELKKIFQIAGKYDEENKGVLSGITMEGPFLSKEKKGAQKEEYLLEPDYEFFRKMNDLCNHLIKQVAIAPEKDEDFSFIKKASKDTVVSLAHSMADYERAGQAFQNGASHVTHLFNGMQPFSHREPGIVGAALDEKNVYVELICDGIHLHPAMVRGMFSLFGAERICMISDSIRATGMPEGQYTLGGQEVFVKEKVARLKDGTIAGSICNLYECFKEAVLHMHIPLEEAITSCTITPAKSLGLEKECGVLLENRKADILILDSNLDIKYVFKNGHL